MAVLLNSTYVMRDKKGGKTTHHQGEVLQLDEQEEQWLIGTNAATEATEKAENDSDLKQKPLDKRSKAELVELAKEYEIADCENLSKALLVEALRAFGLE